MALQPALPPGFVLEGQQSQQPQLPRVIEGAPRQPSPQTPAQATVDQYQAQSAPYQTRERAAAAQRAEIEARQAVRQEQRVANDPAGDAGVDQRRMGGFMLRAQRAEELYRQQGLGPRSLPGQIAADTIPNVTNYLSSAERQQAEAAQAEFVAATLRYESGAAIPPAELEAQRRRYFPMPGDSPETTRLKAELRANAIEALRVSAGQAAGAVRMDPQQYQAELSRLIASGDREAVFQFLQSQGAQVEDPAALEAAIRQRRGVVEQPGQLEPTSGPADLGLGQQLIDSTVNTVAGVGQGLAAIPDAATNAAGAVLSLPAYAVGADWVGDSLRNPVTIGGAIERVAPTPDDFTSQAVRFGAQFTGGAASLPRRATDGITNALVGRVPTPPPPSALRGLPPRSQVMDDANALEIPMLPADVGGPTTRLLTAATAQTPGGAAPIVNASRRTIDAGGRALNRIAGRAGMPTTAEEAGETATVGALRYRARSRAEATRLYDRATSLAGDVRVPPQGATATLERHIAELSENPAGDVALTYLTSLRDRLAQFGGGVTVQGIRGMRTQLRDRFYGEGLRGTDIERRVMEVVDAASDDVANALIQSGRGEAAEVYRAADAAWAARADVLDNIIMPIIGRRGEKSGEQVFQALQSATRGNGARLRSFLAALPEEEVGTVRASIINALGRSSAGRQNAAGDSFSLDQFLTHWNQLSPSARATIFTGETRRSIEALARVAEHTKAAGAYANSSRTGGVVMTGATAASGLGGLPMLALALGGQWGAGRLLASPNVARVIARIGGARNPRQARNAIRSLSQVARRNPALANEIGELESRLMEAFSVSPASRAAANQDQDIR